jgi:hypothetical protein
MIFSFLRKKTEATPHWFTVVDHASFSAEDFYREVEQELAARKVPGLGIMRVEFKEGGLLSDRRVYLRMVRETFVFDVCAAPFGRAYFFSLRFAEIQPEIKPWQIAICLLALSVVGGAAVHWLGLERGLGLAGLLCAGLVWFLRNVIALHLLDLDTMLIRSPIVGPIYLRYFRKDTYYRQDTRLLYHQIVSEIVKQKVEEVTAAKGVKLLKTYEHDPILDGLYKPVTIPLP